MLILTRHAGQRVIVNGNIEIEVLSIKGSQVKLGISAPSDMEVHREEIWLRIQRERGTTNGPEQKT